MLEENNDNLPNPESKADGNPETVQEITQNPEVTSMPSEATESVAVAAAANDVAETETASEMTEDDAEPVPVEVVLEAEIAVEENNSAPGIAAENTAVDTPASETEQVMSALADVTAAESEDATIREEIPMQDYESMPMDRLVSELEELTATDKVMSVRNHVEELKKSFLAKYHHFLDEKREEFYAQNPETTEDFKYHFPLKNKFDQLYSAYRDRINKHFKSLEAGLKSNLEARMAIVEELKNLINPQENIKDALKHFNDLRERWKNCGPIPKDKYNIVWNNYHFHLENFYDYLHLDREARDIEFKHNLEQKQKIIARVEELLHLDDIMYAFRELQDLHRIWKEDIGPVSREHREELWNQFSELTKKMHEKREAWFERFRAAEEDNLKRKKEIIAQITSLAEQKANNHAGWTALVQQVEQLRNAFFATGKVPAEVSEETWSEFKNAVRNFNLVKNGFYKDIKKDQNHNLNLKQALVARAQELQDSNDFEATAQILKQIQEEWKTIGHVPRKYSDQLWTEFRAACNHFFERAKEQRNSATSEELEAFEKKKEYLESLRSFEMTGHHKNDLDAIKAHIENWKSFGKVPASRRHIEGKFNKILDALFEKLSASKKENDMARFAHRVETIHDDGRKIENEKVFISRKIDELQNEIFQLENNIQFFNSKDAKKENPIVTEVRKSIAKHRESLEVWKEKLKQLRQLKSE